ncbi:MAG: 2-C-methyl-D-erythritol 4-phosphate cytidylyltransferase [Chlamydiae bacterium CG10_big_fil_rev_8_21_14_0_10_35_9]|nr:MAG: 2-C-methyl-D-erythritol 4-phosphate cytidylyltransferase [Chlamydiae bacterium CG10_big_fil_rev_8_21_14_0_10_35_9]
MKGSISVILLSGGQGSRFQSNLAKQYHTLKEKPVALYSFEKFLQIQGVVEIIVVTAPEYQHLFSDDNKKISFALPGKKRQDSSFHGFQKISNKQGIILIHDIARPLISLSDILKLIEAAKDYGAATLATPVISTIKQVDKNFCITKTLDRQELWNIQTPQAFHYDILAQGFNELIQNPREVTDDISLVEHFHPNIKIVEGSSKNIKITNPEDLKIAEALL